MPGRDVAHGRVTHQRININLSIVLWLFIIVFVLQLLLLPPLPIVNNVVGEQQKQSCARVRIFLRHE